MLYIDTIALKEHAASTFSVEGIGSELVLRIMTRKMWFSYIGRLQVM